MRNQNYSEATKIKNDCNEKNIFANAGSTFTVTPANTTFGSGFNARETIYGVNNKSNDNK